VPRQVNFSRSLRIAACLGVGSLLLNTLADAGVTAPFPIGNILLFISAAAYGVPGALTATAIGAVTQSLWTGDALYSLRMLVLTLSVAYSMRFAPRVPLFVIPILTWLVLLGPFFYCLGAWRLTPEHWTLSQIVINGLNDALASMIAGTLLMSPSVWGFLTNSPRSVSFMSVLIYTITVTSTLVLTGTITALGGLRALKSFTIVMGPGEQLLILVLFGIAVPVLAAYLLARIMAPYGQELQDRSRLGKTRPAAFLGTTAEFQHRPERPAEKPHNQGLSAQAVGTHKTAYHTPVSTPSAICALRQDGTVLFMNQEFKQLCQIKQNDIVGKDIKTLSGNPTVLNAVLDLAENSFKKGPRLTELKLNNLPDELRFLELSSQCPTPATSTDAPEANSKSVVITLKDITARRTIANNLMQGQKLRALGNLVGGIGHLFNNVLTVIAAQASLARHCSETGCTDKALDTIVRAAQEAGVLVRRLLEFAASQPCPMEPQELGKLIDEKLGLLRQAVGEAYEITFTQSAANPVVICDPNLITQVLTNLVLNAKESYGDKPGEILISLDLEHFDEEVSDMHASARAGDFARLRIKDHGIGMTPEILAAAFEPLYTTKSNGGHIGLGLSTAYAIVRAHDGFLTAESQHEKGTTISLYLPLFQPDLSAQTAERQSETFPCAGQIFEEVRGNNEGILVVEDDDNIREVVSDMLTALGYRVSSCRDGQEALATFAEQPFDLMLVDMIMPKMPGLELVERIRSTNPQTKVLMMTGYGTISEKGAAEVQVISKPFDIETLARAIKGTLRPGPQQFH